jgi:hypothetical protein
VNDSRLVLRRGLFFRISLGTLIALCIALHFALELGTPANYLVTAQGSPTRGWQVHGAQVLQTDAEAPNGSKSALKVTATSGDGHLILRIHAYPHNTSATFSVYLRADSRTTIYIGLQSDNYIPSSARIGQQWQRFTVTGNPVTRGSVDVLVGGMRTFLEGETIYVWGPQLETGRSATPLTSRDVSQLSWLDKLSDEPLLRTDGRSGSPRFCC